MLGLINQAVFLYIILQKEQVGGSTPGIYLGGTELSVYLIPKSCCSLTKPWASLMLS